MTALATAGTPTDPARAPRPVTLPWRRMGWVTWRQHRTAILGVAALSGAMAVCLLVVGVQLHHAATAATACRPAVSLRCADLVLAFDGVGGFLANGLILQPLPALVGAFVGAPVLARELESGTVRFAWTQGFGRVRWTLAKLVGLGAAVLVATGAVSALSTWYYQPYFASGRDAISPAKAVELSMSPFAVGLFDVRGVDLAAWTLLAFSIGVLAGMLTRRVLPAVVATLAAYTALAFVTSGWLRQHYLTPLVTKALAVPSGAWVVSQHWATRSGVPVSQAVIDRVLTRAPQGLTGKGGVPQSAGTYRYLVQHGYLHVTAYQPASRFWWFQLIEGGWLVVLSVLLLAATVWLVRRRAA